MLPGEGLPPPPSCCRPYTEGLIVGKPRMTIMKFWEKRRLRLMRHPFRVVLVSPSYVIRDDGSHLLPRAGAAYLSLAMPIRVVTMDANPKPASISMR